MLEQGVATFTKGVYLGIYLWLNSMRQDKLMGLAV